MHYILHLLGLVLVVHCKSLNRTEFRKQYTAGNTRCRSGMQCGYHEGKPYSWCYIDKEDHWEYCCTDQCGYNGYDYIWCKSGNTWEFCSKPGAWTINGTRCQEDHLCGRHRFDTTERGYWCYTDPGHTRSSYCCPPGIKPCIIYV
ncbi:hypothetical protein CHS0354_020705 [Potamilus streckersoni]|uniref:Uncharacterized protein n=1 Tax=Potamilus streckersoni TaxID=2493646 RepID=A0AAE0S801_9BIVA|nr:hypothetical protein CHS0354_020705 [Potamilus streckersoni]